ncbi:WD40 repeat [Dillenia turbinata]|uniref:WD40 repeat n=1 Tax=Dillenia turbinata TaxID=194707 RepID=A0AAN8YZB2_9MAGN
MTETARKLRGHGATATCCAASRLRPGLIATSGEDGKVCWFDLRCKDLLFTLDVSQNPVSSLCFRPDNEDIVHLEEKSWKPLDTFNYNKEEINQVSCNSRSSFLVTADDGGDAKIIDIRQQRLYKSLRAGHSSICSSVQFIPWRPWEVITGGLDSKLVLWDFSKGRPQKIVDFGMPDVKRSSSAGQCFNPAFVHSIAVPEADMLDKTGKICAVARGDGVVNVIDIESELSKPKSSLKSQKGSLSRAKDIVPTSDTKTQEESERRLYLDYTMGGHTAAVSCVAFSLFGEKGKLIISGGNDRLVKIWDVEGSGISNDLLRLTINLSKKVNWLSTTPSDSENLIVCDTSKIVKVYTIS